MKKNLVPNIIVSVEVNIFLSLKADIYKRRNEQELVEVVDV